MTRTGDLVPPTVSGTHPEGTEVAQHLRIALERLPDAAYVWDDADEEAVVWDAPGDVYVWDAPFVGGGFTDAVCDFHAVTIDAGHIDENGLFGSAEAVITLDNADGEYSQRASDGRLVYWATGRRVCLLGEADGQWWWLFGGRVTGWDENPDGTVTVTAADGFAQLARDVSADWTPGTASQTVSQRIASICAKWGYTDPTNLAVTDVRMGNPLTDRSPLEEIQVTAMSDAGFVFCDQDGRLVYRGRDWPGGRSDQVTVHTFSDNLCDGSLIVWDLQIISDDVALATRVELENYEDPAKVATASATVPQWEIPYVFSHPQEDLWMSQADGDRLAQDLLARHGTDAPRFGWALHLRDPNQDLWRPGIDLRLGDKVNVVRTFPAAGGEEGLIDVDGLVTGITHEINPDAWLVTVETSRVVTYRSPLRWDRSPYTWDDPNAANVWSH